MNIERLDAAKDVKSYADSIRGVLNEVYDFPASSYEIMELEPGFAEKSKDTILELLNVMKAAKLDQDGAINEVLRFHYGTEVATCYHTGKNFRGRDYVILFKEPEKQDKIRLACYFGEEIMHGEHGTLHDYNGENVGGKKFSDIAAECIGSFGFDVGVKFAKSKGLGIDFNVEKAKVADDGKLSLDASHVIGYQIGNSCLNESKVDRKKLFHEPDEKSLWKGVNEIIIPDVNLWIPKEWEGSDHELTKAYRNYVADFGLDCNFKVVRV
jgi:hypothetical protein